ncbi:nuclear transport factor 2 family protein [Agrococcus versicolor]|uniref:Nuclear transport factor 2 family protein n=1 Tax=Agrococcus versicolor TaxID=501482 RepID=A0ABP5MLW6_9MICO
MSDPTEQDILDAAAAIVDAFAATDGDRYFALFAPEASFIFHTEPQRLDRREAYEALWREWVASGWRVVSCVSSEQLVTPMPGGAVFSHTVSTSVVTPDGPESYEERETIVFRASSAGLLAIHEHLSPKP